MNIETGKNGQLRGVPLYKFICVYNKFSFRILTPLEK